MVDDRARDKEVRRELNILKIEAGRAAGIFLEARPFFYLEPPSTHPLSPFEAFCISPHPNTGEVSMCGLRDVDNPVIFSLAEGNPKSQIQQVLKDGCGGIK